VLELETVVPAHPEVLELLTDREAVPAALHAHGDVHHLAGEVAPDGGEAHDLVVAVADEPEYEENRFPDGDDEIVRFATIRRDLATQMMDVTMRMERRRDGVPVGEEFERFRMRWYHRFELEHLLARAGFEIAALYGGFDRRPYDRASEDALIVARLAG